MRNRPYESWMRKGALVQLSTNTGTLDNVAKANIDGQEVVISVCVTPTGRAHPFPFNPWDISPVATKQPAPFPEHIG